MADVEVLKKSEVQAAIDAYNAAKSDLAAGLSDAISNLETNDAQVQTAIDQLDSAVATANAYGPVTFQRGFAGDDDLTVKPATGNGEVEDDISYYFKNGNVFQLIRLESGAWLDFSKPNATKEYVDDKASLFALIAEDVNADGVTDDSAAIQALLDLKGEIWLPKGDYLIETPLKVYSNTILRLHKEAKLIRGTDTQGVGILQNGDTDVNGYNGESNIIIDGGIFDGNSSFTTNSNLIDIGHGENITIQNSTFINGLGWHYIELNSTKNGKVLNCVFEELDINGRADTEAIQIDFASGAGSFPAFGNYDNTPCKNILISGCFFNCGVTGVGNHLSATGVKHENIVIENCFFENLTVSDKGYAIRFENAQNITIRDCFISGCKGGIQLIAGSSTDIFNSSIKSVSIKNGASLAADFSAIKLQALTGSTLTDSVIEDVYIFSGGWDGIYLVLCGDTRIINSHIRGISNRNAVYIYKSDDTIINECNFFGSLNHDVEIGPNFGAVDDTQYCIVSNSVIGDVQIGYCRYANVKDNIIKTTIGVDPNAVNYTIRGNNPFDTENSGYALITSGNTSVDVPHGLNITPSINDISVTPSNNIGNATKWWISDVGATTFRINVDTDPAGNADFRWKIN